MARIYLKENTKIMRVHQSVQNIGLSKIVQISEQAAKIAPEFEQRTGLPFIYFQRGEVGFPTPKFIAEGYQKAFDKGLTKYPKAGGEPLFKESILTSLGGEGIHGLDPSNIVVTSGGQEGLQLALNLFRGGRCLVLTPAWPCLFDNIFPYTETTPIEVPLKRDTWDLDFTAIEKELPNVDTLYFNNPNNPTGKVFAPHDVSRLADMCHKYGVVMICDDAYMDLIYNGKHECPVKEFENVIVVRTFSKSFAATGLRVGYAFSRRADLIAHMIKSEYTQTAGIPQTAQYAFADALHHPDRRTFQENLRNTMKQRGEAAHKILGDPISFDSSFYWFADMLKIASIPYIAQAWTDILLTKGIAVIPGTAFGKNFEYHVRLSFSTLSNELVEAGMKRFLEHVR